MEYYINTLNKFPTITYDSRVLIKTIWIYVLELPIKQILITEEKEIYRSGQLKLQLQIHVQLL